MTYHREMVRAHPQKGDGVFLRLERGAEHRLAAFAALGDGTRQRAQKAGAHRLGHRRRPIENGRRGRAVMGSALGMG